MKVHTYCDIQLGNANLDFGWHRGEPFTLFHLTVLEIGAEYEMGRRAYFVTILKIQIAKFILILTYAELPQ